MGALFILLICLIGVAVVVLLWAVAVYNRLIRKRNRVKESWAQIDVQLKRRYDLIPNLVETVKGYASHEKQTFENVTTARAELKANENFLGLLEELSSTENKIGFARQHYNEVTRNFNTSIQQAPANVIAGMFGFTESDYFELEEPAAREAPKVEF